MSKQFKSISLSHKQAPIEVRERVSLNEPQAKSLMRKIQELTGASDLLVLSTCNRTELYYSAQEEQTATILQLLTLEKRLASVEEIKPYFEAINDHGKAVQHLFEVSMGLDAQVVGDMQISNQVKTAYQWSADEDVAGPFLHRLLHTIFFSNKRVVQETSFRDGAASVSYATTELVKEIAQQLPEARILVLGLGEIGLDVCKNLADSELTGVSITNRTLSKAEAIAQECDFEVVPFEQAQEAILTHDVIISSLAMEQPFIQKAQLQAQDQHQFKYFFDLSVPRSIEPSIEEIPGMILYNLDQIQSKASEALQRRLAAIPDVKAIIADAILNLNSWAQEMEVSPVINRLKNALETIRQEEMARYLKNIPESESKRIDKITKSMMQKVIKLPVLQLKAACKRGEAETLIDVLNDLFNLEEQFDQQNIQKD